MAAAIGEVCLACPASLAAALPADFTSCRPLHTLALGWKSFSLARGNISNISSLTPCVQAGSGQADSLQWSSLYPVSLQWSSLYPVSSLCGVCPIKMPNPNQTPQRGKFSSPKSTRLMLPSPKPVSSHKTMKKRSSKPNSKYLQDYDCDISVQLKPGGRGRHLTHRLNPEKQCRSIFNFM